MRDTRWFFNQLGWTVLILLCTEIVIADCGVLAFLFIGWVAIQYWRELWRTYDRGEPCTVGDLLVLLSCGSYIGLGLVRWGVRYAPVLVAFAAGGCGGQVLRVDWVLVHELGHSGGLGHQDGSCMAALNFSDPLPSSELCPFLAPEGWLVEPDLAPSFDTAAEAWCQACGWCPWRSPEASNVVQWGELREHENGRYHFDAEHNTQTITVALWRE
jgi:hypothetical protein